MHSYFILSSDRRTNPGVGACIWMFNPFSIASLDFQCVIVAMSRWTHTLSIQLAHLCTWVIPAWAEWKTPVRQLLHALVGLKFFPFTALSYWLLWMFAEERPIEYLIVTLAIFLYADPALGFAKASYWCNYRTSFVTHSLKWERTTKKQRRLDQLIHQEQ